MDSVRDVLSRLLRWRLILCLTGSADCGEVT